MAMKWGTVTWPREQQCHCKRSSPWAFSHCQYTRASVLYMLHTHTPAVCRHNPGLVYRSLCSILRKEGSSMHPLCTSSSCPGSTHAHCHDNTCRTAQWIESHTTHNSSTGSDTRPAVGPAVSLPPTALLLRQQAPCSLHTLHTTQSPAIYTAHMELLPGQGRITSSSTATPAHHSLLPASAAAATAGGAAAPSDSPLALILALPLWLTLARPPELPPPPTPGGVAGTFPAAPTASNDPLLTAVPLTAAAAAAVAAATVAASLLSLSRAPAERSDRSGRSFLSLRPLLGGALPALIPPCGLCADEGVTGCGPG